MQFGYFQLKSSFLLGFGLYLVNETGEKKLNYKVFVIQFQFNFLRPSL